MLVTSVLVGLLAGWSAGIVAKGGGHGLRSDVCLGLGGSVAGIWMFQALAGPGAGGPMPVVAAFVGASLVIVAQRRIWPRRAERMVPLVVMGTASRVP